MSLDKKIANGIIPNLTYRVVCQVNLSKPIDNISISYPPYDFHEKIADEFPLMDKGDADFNFLGNDDFLYSYEMSTIDKNKSIYVNDSFFCFSFLVSSGEALDIFSDFEKYVKLFFNAYGLNENPVLMASYQFIYDRKRLGFESPAKSLGDLVNKKYIDQMYSEKFLGGRVTQVQSKSFVEFPEDGVLMSLVHGTIFNVKSKETCYIVDCEFLSTSDMEINNARGKLCFFDERAASVALEFSSQETRTQLSI